MIKNIKRLFTRSFSIRLSFSILGVISVLFILAFIGNYSSARKHVQKESIERAESALENTILRIDNVLQTVETTIHNLSWTALEKLDSPDELYSITRHIVESNSFISGSAIAFEPNYYKEKGVFFAPYSYRNNGKTDSKQLGAENYDYHYMDWYQIPRLLNKPYWSEPYYDDGGSNLIMTTYSYPLYDKDGKFIAIFTADISLEWFAEQVNSIKPYPNAYNIMIGRGGTYLVHDKKEFILSETMFSTAIQSEDSTMMATIHKMVDGEKGMSEFERQEKQFNLFYAPVEATGWSVAVACLHSDIFAGVENMRANALWVALIGLTLLTLFCFVIIRRMTKPLTQFAQSATDIAHGNFSAKLPAIKSHDEMRQLHNSFNYMQKSLRKHIEELKQTTANRERIESELRIARAIQMGMVPKTFPPFPEREDIDLYAKLLPAKEVGGDLYDYFIEDDKLHFIIGDVSGKGIPASLVMAVTCRLFRTTASHIPTPEGIVSTLNEALADSNESNMFCTAFVGILDLKSGILNYCNAGHNPPIVIDTNGKVTTLKVKPNLALGVWPGFNYLGESVQMEKRSTLFMYTDGVTEAEDIDKKLFGEERLIEILQQLKSQSPQTITENILNNITEHAKNTEQSDDITILCYNLSMEPTVDSNEKIVLLNDIKEIGRMATFLDELAEKHNLPVETAFNIHLALEETVSNVIMYAYPNDEEHEIVLTAHKNGNRLIFKIIDSGKEFDPTKQPDADVTLSLEERPIGGLGIFLIRNIMQVVEYNRIDDKNVLTLVKIIED